MEKSGRLRQFVDGLWGHDVFISYRRKDGTDYATKLFTQIQSVGIACFLDNKIYLPGDNLRLESTRQAAKSTILILLTTPEYLVPRETDWVREEFKCYFASNSDPKVIVVDFGRTLSKDSNDPNFAKLSEFIRIEEPIAALDNDPTPSILNAINNQLKGRSQNLRRKRFFQVSALGAALLVSGLLFYVKLAEQRRIGELRNQSLSLAALSETALQQGDPLKAVKLALAAWPRVGDDDRPQTEEVLESLRRSLPKLSTQNTFEVDDNGWGRTVYIKGGSEALVTSSFYGSSDYKLLKRISTRDGKVLAKVQLTEPLHEIVADTNGTLIVDLDYDHEARLINATNGETLHRWQSPQRLPRLQDDAGQTIKSVAIDPSGKIVLLGREDGTVDKVGVTTGEILATFHPHTERVEDVNFSNDGLGVVSASKDGTALVWNAVDGLPITRFTGHSVPKNEYYGQKPELGTAVFSPDGRMIATTGNDGTIRVWRADGGKQEAVLNLTKEIVIGQTKLEFSADSTFLGLISRSGENRYWDYSTCTNIAIEAHGSPIEAFGMPMGRVSGLIDKLAGNYGCTYPVTDENIDGAAERYQKAIRVVAISSGADLVASAVLDGPVMVWDAKTGEEIKKFSEHKGSVNSINFTHSGSLIVTASDDGTIHVWDTRNGKVEITFIDNSCKNSDPPENTCRVDFAEFSPDDQFIVSRNHELQFRVWSLVNKREWLGGLPEVLVGRALQAFSVDGKLFAAESQNGIFNIYDLEKKLKISTVDTGVGSDDEINFAIFDPNIEYFVTGSRVPLTEADSFGLPKSGKS